MLQFAAITLIWLTIALSIATGWRWAEKQK
jgi:hypothetical protein